MISAYFNNQNPIAQEKENCQPLLEKAIYSVSKICNSFL